MRLEIPGRGLLTISHVVFDFNGTLAEDGRVADDTAELLDEAAAAYQITIATADTFGTVGTFAAARNIALKLVKDGRDKEALVKSLSGGVAAVGNGANDRAMFFAADLAIAVIGPEGAAFKAIEASDIVVPSINQALALLLNTTRIIATLRE